MSKKTIIAKANEAKATKEAKVNAFKAFAEAQLNNLTPTLDNTTTNAQIRQYLNTEVTVTFNTFHVDNKIYSECAFQFMVYNLTINNKPIDYTMTASYINSDMEVMSFSGYKYFQNKMMNLVNGATVESLKGKSFIMMPIEDDRGYVNMEVIGLA